MSPDKVYSNRLLKGVVDFVEERFGRALTDEILSRVGLDRLQLNDMSGYATMEIAHSLVATAVELTGDKTIAYQAGRNLPHALGKVGGFIVGITSPAMFMKSLGQIEARLALKTVNRTTPAGRGRWRVEITFRDGFREPPYVCENRIGCYESAPLFFGLPYAKVTHPQCLHRGQGNCVYFVDFPEHRFLAFKRSAAVSGMAALIAGAFAFRSHAGAAGWLAPLALAALGLLFFSLYKHLGAKRSLEWSLLINEGLVQQNALLERMNSRMIAFHRLTAAIMDSPGPERALEAFAKGVASEMGFGSCSVWRLAPDARELRCIAAAGLPEPSLRLACSKGLSLDPEAEGRHGLLAEALRGRKAFIAEDIQSILPRISGPAAGLLRELGYTALILYPLVDADESAGLLIGGYHKGEKVGTQDRAVFQSLATTLTAVLMRAKLRAGKGTAGVG